MKASIDRREFICTSSLLATGVCTLSGSPAEASTLSAMLPDAIGGWEPAGPDAVYDRSTLFDYIDGTRGDTRD